MEALNMMEEKYYRINEVAAKLSVSRLSVYNYMDEKDPKKKLNYVYIGKVRKISETELQRYIRENTK